MVMVEEQAQRYQQLFAAKDEILSAWLSQVKIEIPYACALPHQALINTLPLFFDHLVLTTVGEGQEFDHAVIAAEHGGQRARVTRFHAGSIAHEFQLFRSAIIDTWHRAGIILRLDEVERVNKAIDIALRESLAGFSLAQVQIREQFFAALTHDLRAPLSAAATAVQVIRATDDLERAHRMAVVAVRNHARLEAMIGDLLDMMVLNAGTATLELTPVELYELASEAATSIGFSSGRDIRMRGQRIHGKWNAAALRRAIENLLTNAVKYSDKGTPINVVVAELEGSATVEVTNTGPPVPSDHAEAIFQLFRRAVGDGERGIAGWGIGLPYVRTVAEQHGGSVIVRSGERSTTFALRLPLDHV